MPVGIKVTCVLVDWGRHSLCVKVCRPRVI